MLNLHKRESANKCLLMCQLESEELVAEETLELDESNSFVDDESDLAALQPWMGSASRPKVSISSTTLSECVGCHDLCS